MRRVLAPGEDWPLGTYKCPQCLTVFFKPKKQCCQQVRWRCFCAKEMRLRGKKEHIQGDPLRGRPPCPIYRSMQAEGNQDLRRESLSFGTSATISVVTRGDTKWYNTNEFSKVFDVKVDPRELHETLVLQGDTYTTWLSLLKLILKVQNERAHPLHEEVSRLIEHNTPFSNAEEWLDSSAEESEALAAIYLENLAKRRVFPLF